MASSSSTATVPPCPSQQIEENISAAKVRKLIQQDFFEQAKIEIPAAMQRENSYTRITSDIFPEPNHAFVHPLLRALRGEGYFVLGVFLGKWGCESGMGGRLTVYCQPPSFAQHDSEKRYRIRYQTKNYNNFVVSREALYNWVRQDIGRILITQSAGLQLISLGESTSWIPQQREGRAENDATRRGEPFLQRTQNWVLNISKPKEELSVFFSKAAQIYEQAMMDWCKKGTSRVCEALSYALPHEYRKLLIEEAAQQNGVP